VPNSKRLSLFLASTAAVALASLPLAVSPANAAKVSEGTTSSISVVEAASNASQFNLGNRGVQSVAIYDGRVGGDFQERCHSLAATQAAWINGSAMTGSGSSVCLLIHTSSG
jgi:hypothetical protein